MLEHQPKQTQNLSHTRTPIELMQKSNTRKRIKIFNSIFNVKTPKHSSSSSSFLAFSVTKQNREVKLDKYNNEKARQVETHETHIPKSDFCCFQKDELNTQN